MASLTLNDLSYTAEHFVSLLSHGRQLQAFTELEHWRALLPLELRDALDRKIAWRLTRLAPRFLWPPMTWQFDLTMSWRREETQRAITRIQAAATQRPPMPETAGLNRFQLYDIYSSIVETRGNAAAVSALDANQRVIVGLRVETSTLANRGQGVYDDRLVVIAKGTDGGAPSVHEFTRASTEPTAQYDGNQRNNSNVTFRRAEGVNISGNHEPELGRLAEGTIEMLETTHPNPRRAGTNFSLRPTSDAVRNGADGVQRDTNHDGYFNDADVGGRVSLNNTFKIHSGSMNNTDSAGCQTLHPDDFAAFREAVSADSAQARWYYVLTETRPRTFSEWRVPMRLDPATPSLGMR